LDQQAVGLVEGKHRPGGQGPPVPGGEEVPVRELLPQGEQDQVIVSVADSQQTLLERVGRLPARRWLRSSPSNTGSVVTAGRSRAYRSSTAEAIAWSEALILLRAAPGRKVRRVDSPQRRPGSGGSPGLQTLPPRFRAVRRRLRPGRLPRSSSSSAVPVGQLLAVLLTMGQPRSRPQNRRPPERGVCSMAPGPTTELSGDAMGRS
jgi:hypothetical protein